MPPTRVVNVRAQTCDVYCGRGSDWGNPYSHQPSAYDVIHVKTREEAIRGHLHYLMHNTELRRRIKRELQGKTLGCYCKPMDCHCDILALLADLP